MGMAQFAGLARVATPVWDGTQQCWMLTNVAIDITKRKQLEAHLRQSEAELRALFEAMDDLVMVLDRQGRYFKSCDQ